jgi:hypothetical protein
MKQFLAGGWTVGRNIQIDYREAPILGRHRVEMPGGIMSERLACQCDACCDHGNPDRAHWKYSQTAAAD